MLEIGSIVLRREGNWDLKISAQIPAGSWTSIIGPSGSGKSTLLMAIAGFLPLAEGTLVRDGINLTGKAPHERSFGYVFQDDNLFGHLTVRENLLLALHGHKTNPQEKLKIIKDTLGPLGIPLDYLDKSPRELSGGEKARIAVARALVPGHKWLLLDEAFGSLDRPLRLHIQAWIERSLLAKGVTIVSVTHQNEDALLFSDHILALAKGRLIHEAALEHLTRPDHPRSQGVTAESRKLGRLLGESSQVEDANGSLSLVDEDAFRLDSPSSQGRAQDQEWVALPLKHPRLLPSSQGCLLRDRGTLTLLRLRDRPEQIPQIIWIRKGHSGGLEMIPDSKEWPTTT